MSIKVRYFANLKETLGRAGEEFTVTEPLPIREIWQALNPERVMPENLLAAVNMEYADFDTQVNDGDELAFFPPVTGG